MVMILSASSVDTFIRAHWKVFWTIFNSWLSHKSKHLNVFGIHSTDSTMESYRFLSKANLLLQVRTRLGFLFYIISFMYQIWLCSILRLFWIYSLMFSLSIGPVPTILGPVTVALIFVSVLGALALVDLLAIQETHDHLIYLSAPENITTNSVCGVHAARLGSRGIHRKIKPRSDSWMTDVALADLGAYQWKLKFRFDHWISKWARDLDFVSFGCFGEYSSNAAKSRSGFLPCRLGQPRTSSASLPIWRQVV